MFEKLIANKVGIIVVGIGTLMVGGVIGTLAARAVSSTIKKIRAAKQVNGPTEDETEEVED